MKILISAVAILVLLTMLPIQITWARYNISEGIVINYGVPREGITVLYKYIDKTSGTFGSDTITLKENGEMHLMGFSSEVDNGYFPGDKVIVTVSRYDPLNPQPIIDTKTITLGETGGILSFNLSNG
jgi:hypothetical protein